MKSERGETCLWQKRGDSWVRCQHCQESLQLRNQLIVSESQQSKSSVRLAGLRWDARLQSVIKGKRGEEMSQEKSISLAQGGNGKV